MKVSCAEQKIKVPAKLQASKCVNIAVVDGKIVHFELESGKTVTYELYKVITKNDATGKDEWTVDMVLPGGEPSQVQLHLNLRNVALPVIRQLHDAWRKMNLKLAAERLKLAAEEKRSASNDVLDLEVLETDRSMFEDAISRIKARSEKYGSGLVIY
jgi:hypothetical protein